MRIKRVLGTFLVTAALVGLVPAQAAMASTTYLGPWSNHLARTTSMTESVYVAWKFTVTSTATITYGTGSVADDPATTPASEIAIYPSSGAGSGSWTPMGILAQHSWTPDTAPSDFLVSYTGSISLAPGTYYAAQRYTSAFSGQASGGDGALSSPWQWGPPVSGNYAYYFTTDSGSTWNLYSNSYSSSITLSDGPPEPAAGSASILQQVPVPATGSCTDVQDSALSWSTGLTGGWGRSWAEWNQGPVCTRNLAYSNGRWYLN
jgi:hypothetical protein